MKLTCLRHGLTPLNRAHRFNGSIQEGITPDQRLELEEVRFDAGRFERVYCSPLRRCIETAVALGIGGLVPDARIAERNLGIFEGLTADECRLSYPEAFEAFSVLDADYAIPRGESRAQHLQRVLAWLEEAVSYREVLAVTHGGTIDFLYRMADGMPLHGGGQIYGSMNASLTTFVVEWPDLRLLGYSASLASVG